MFTKAAGANQTATLAQATDYYPFGKSFENVNISKNRYLYNGKELQDQLIGGTQFGWYDYGARFYDPEIARWHSVDPMAEWRYSFSPYDYCRDNPINRIDPDGMYDLPEVVIRPSRWQRFKNWVKKVDTSLQGNGGSQPAGYTFVTAFGANDPTRQKAGYNHGTVNVDALLFAMSKATAGPLEVPGPLRPAETANDVKDAIDESIKIINDLKKGKTDENVKEKQGDKTDNKGKKLNKTLKIGERSITTTHYDINTGTEPVSVIDFGDPSLFNGDEKYYPNDTIMKYTMKDGKITSKQKYPPKHKW